jgi:hypothetical protein
MFLTRFFISHSFRCTLILAILAIAISSCSDTTSTEPSTPVPSILPTFTTPSATLTPTPVIEKVVLFGTDHSSHTFSQPVSAILSELAQNQGWKLIETEERPVQEFLPGTRVVVVLPPDPGLQTIAFENPDIQFLSIGISGLQPASNLNIIGPDGFREDRIAFIAGYISTVLTKDWRSGLINQAPSEWTTAINQSFTNGVVYYCGICQLTYPPYYDYPISTSLSEAATDSDWESAINTLISQSVRTVFIYSSEVNLPALENLSQNGIALFGTNSPPDALEESWITTIRFAPETKIRDHWEDLVNQNGGWVEEVPIILDNVNGVLFSVGKQDWVQEIIDDVVGGYIETGSKEYINSP